MKKEDLKKGTRIYYNGDQANEEGLGVITEQTIDEWGTRVDIKMDDGRKIGKLNIAMFSDEYLGHGGTRFVTEEAYRDFRQAAIDKIEAQLAENDAKRSTPGLNETEMKKLGTAYHKGIDDKNISKYVIWPLATDLLVKIADGSVDMKQLAYEELEKRGAVETKGEPKYSRLEKLMQAGTVTVKNGTYMGTVKWPSGDLGTVPLGNVGEEDRINEYLAKCPSPSTWINK